MADPHFGHYHIIEYCNRPYKNIEEMDNDILFRTNSMVGRNDRLIVAGDFGMASLSALQAYRQKINCKNISFVLGNHDSRAKIETVFGKNNTRDILKISNPNAIVCHYPIAVWDKQHRGYLHFYGHCHSNAEENLDKIFPQRRSMDVGVDNIYKLYGYYGPVDVNRLAERLSTRTGYNIDHHGSKYDKAEVLPD
jgi:calcineurin-like phosphoesterase family protein